VYLWSYWPAILTTSVADNDASDNEHLKRMCHATQAEQDGGDESEDVYKQDGATSVSVIIQYNHIVSLVLKFFYLISI
jgi:hypothetical protein